MRAMSTRTPFQRWNPVLGLCLVLIALGVYLRLQALGFPEGLSWDEHHFVKNARNYLIGEGDWNDHPPLGKLFMALAIHTLGDTSTAFRLPSAVCGLGTLAAVALIARRLFPLPWAGLLAAACFAVDGFFISYSRAALLDGMMTCLTLCSFYLALVARRAAVMWAAALLAGLALSVKTSGLLAMVPVVYFSLAARRPLWLLSLAASVGVFYGQWAYGLALTGKAWDPASAYQVQADLMKHHAALTEMKHPLTSRWYTWLVPVQPIRMRTDPAPGGLIRVMTTLGHPLLWWCTSVLIAIGSLRLFLRGVLNDMKDGVSRAGTVDAVVDSSSGAGSGFFVRHRASVALLVLMWWLQMSPWILTRRDSYAYHYLPAYSFGLLLVAGGLAHLLSQRPRIGLAVLSLVMAVALFYAPVWGQLPISAEGSAMRLFIPSWR